MNISNCVICGGASVEILSAAAGERAYCYDCFHGWRTAPTPFTYSAIAMCSLGTSAARLKGQVSFFAPFCPESARILEIGCATGELASAVRKELSPSCYEAIEISPAGGEAAGHLDRLHVQPLPILLEENSIEPGFDLILMSHVLEHLQYPAAELRAMKRVLRPAGAIFVEVPNRSGHRNLPIDDNQSRFLPWQRTRGSMRAMQTPSGWLPAPLQCPDGVCRFCPTIRCWLVRNGSSSGARAA